MRKITDSYISSEDARKLLDDVKKIYVNGKIVCDTHLIYDLAERLEPIEKEVIRYDLIFDYGFEHGIPEIIDILDRDTLIDAYVESDRGLNVYASADDIYEYLTTEPKDYIDEIKDFIERISDGEKHFADPIAYEHQMKEDALWDE